jgi:hypothetical protein
MDEEGAAPYVAMNAGTTSYRWYKPKGAQTGKYIEVETWQVHVIPCARWDSGSQRLHVVSPQLHGDVGNASSSSAPYDTLPPR